MTEAEWQASDEPTELLGHVCKRISARKIRLSGPACVRAHWHRVSDWRCRQVVRAAEDYADGQATLDELAEACRLVRSERAAGIATLVRQLSRADPVTAAYEALYAARRLVAHAVSTRSDVRSLATVRLPNEATAFRCLFGNPFRPVTLDPAWLTSTVVALAEGVYRERAFDRLPILADALQDAGCGNDELLDHCRRPGPHVRGCWVIDLLLGKE